MEAYEKDYLTYRGRVTHRCIDNLNAIIGSDDTSFLFVAKP